MFLLTWYICIHTCREIGCRESWAASCGGITGECESMYAGSWASGTCVERCCIQSQTTSEWLECNDDGVWDDGVLMMMVVMILMVMMMMVMMMMVMMIIVVWQYDDLAEEAGAEVGIHTSNPNAPTVLRVIENTKRTIDPTSGMMKPAMHHVVVCTLCSCYPTG